MNRAHKKPQPEIVSVRQTARRLDVSDGTIRRLIDSGDLTAHRIGRNWRIFEADFQAYLTKTANQPSLAGRDTAA